MSIQHEVFRTYTAHHPEIRTLVETGTFQGQTAFEALRYFERVMTVEHDLRLCREAHARYMNMGIDFYFGDSAEFLRRNLSKVEGDAFIYLDAHWSGWGEAPEVLPLWAELQAIFETGRSSDVIAIDDVRLCGTNHAGGWKETTLQKICEALLTINPSYRFALEPGIMPGDVLVAHLGGT